MVEELKDELATIGKDPVQITAQFNLLQRGFQPIQLQSPCTVGKGILQLSSEEKNKYLKFFEAKSGTYDSLRFVPASGAASRMFKHLRNPDLSAPLTREFFQNLESFPFFDELAKRLGNKPDFSDPKNARKISTLLLEDMNYGNLPKGSVLFHKYGGKSRTAFQEQIHEAAGVQDFPHIHFTVSADYLDRVKTDLESYCSIAFPNKEIKLDFSVQLSKTDTIALNEKGEIFRKKDGSVLFRPGGHGSLIHNLNSLSTDVAVIKNIDNIVRESRQDTCNNYKKILIGLGLELKQFIDRVLSAMDQTNHPDYNDVERLCSILGIENDKNFIKNLDRPLRICGMVENTGEPGGGPFWVKQETGEVSKQIVEKAQVDFSDPEQEKIFLNSTHFNPVDLVCFLKDHKGKKYDLIDYVDSQSSFITEKSFEGEDIKVLEHPGLWNGAMAGWNTVFVEVPLSTFNPVKTVNDLLRPSHRE